MKGPEAGKPEGRWLDDLGEGCWGEIRRMVDWERGAKQKGQRLGKATDQSVTEIRGGAASQQLPLWPCTPMPSNLSCCFADVIGVWLVLSKCKFIFRSGSVRKSSILDLFLEQKRFGKCQGSEVAFPTGLLGNCPWSLYTLAGAPLPTWPEVDSLAQPTTAPRYGVWRDKPCSWREPEPEEPSKR